MNKLTLAAALVASMTGMTAAHAYQMEAGADYTYFDVDNGDSVNGFGVDATYYFNPVTDSNAPLAEAGFMNRAGNVKARIATDDSDNDATQFGLGAEYYIPNTDFYVSGNVSRTEFDDDHANQFGAEIGYLPAPNFLVAAGLVRTKAGDDSNTDPSIRAKYVTRVGEHDWNFEAGGVFGDNDQYNVAADYYVDNTFSIGGQYVNTDIGPSDYDVFTVRARKFFNQQMSLQGELGFGDDTNTFGLRGTYRF